MVEKNACSHFIWDDHRCWSIVLACFFFVSRKYRIYRQLRTARSSKLVYRRNERNDLCAMRCIRHHRHSYIYEMLGAHIECVRVCVCEWFDNHQFICFAHSFCALKCCFRLRELVCLQKSISILNECSYSQIKNETRVCTEHLTREVTASWLFTTNKHVNMQMARVFFCHVIYRISY